MMATMNDQLTVQVVGPLIMAQLRGVPTPELLRECQEQVLALAQGARVAKVLYDAREMEPPAVDVPWAQRHLDEGMSKTHLRRAIVVPNSRLAFLARLAFGAGDYRVFYDDIDAATHWLTHEGT
jgi:hypothetical protein